MNKRMNGQMNECTSGSRTRFGPKEIWDFLLCFLLGTHTKALQSLSRPCSEVWIAPCPGRAYPGLCPRYCGAAVGGWQLNLGGSPGVSCPLGFCQNQYIPFISRSWLKMYHLQPCRSDVLEQSVARINLDWKVQISRLRCLFLDRKEQQLATLRAIRRNHWGLYAWS